MRIMHISVDLSEASRYLAHAKVHLPVKPESTARFTTPLWIPESHIKNGPVGGIVGLHFYFLGENGAEMELRWSRDPQAAHEYVVQIPPGIDRIFAEFDAIVTRNFTRRIILFGWEHVLLYPLGNKDGRHKYNVDKIPIQASVAVPAGWGIATALENLGDPALEKEGDKSTYHYQPTTVRRLADSPILAGLYFRQYTLHQSPNFNTEEVLCVTADEDKYTHISEDILSKLTKMIIQTQLLFGGGPPPYATRFISTKTGLKEQKGPHRFYFLLALTTHLPNIGGIEHLSSAALILPLKAFSTQANSKESLPLITHEYIHSWNGKRRIPAGHNTPDFNTPLDGRLLWVYEGLTTYYEGIISVRAGMLSKEDWINQLAGQVAYLKGQGGRYWRSLEDLGAGTSVMNSRMDGWESWRGERDGFYVGGALVWLGVDVLLRRLTFSRGHGSMKGKGRSLDDFMALFFGLRENPHGKLALGGKGGKQRAVEYTLEDIIDGLNDICEHDWRAYFQERVVDVMPEVDLSGIEMAGYRFAWTNEPPNMTGSTEGDEDGNRRRIVELKQAIWNSIGIEVTVGGRIEDVRRWGPADEAGLAPRQTIIGVGKLGDGERRFDIFELGKDISRCSENKNGPLQLVIAHEEDQWVAEINYHDGLRYPIIERDKEGGLSDLLDDILRPLPG